MIPRGSFVNGTVTISKPAGRTKGKGELFVRFDSLTLPNGATRDFRSRLGSAEGAKVDREEGKVSGERDTARIRASMVEAVAMEPLATIDYIEIVDDETLEPVERTDKPTLVALAVKFSKTRLIDNTVLK